MALLEVRDLSLVFESDRENTKALDSVSFDLYSGEIVALVGESGSGKSVMASTIMRLISTKSATGNIYFEGEDLLQVSEKVMKSVRGKKIGMIFQDPMTSLNPTLKIGSQIMEGLKLPRKERHEKALEMLFSVGISDPKKRINQYPYQLSGGMRQRVMIAVAMILSPKLLIADEPTTALDVTIQAQILELMKSLQKKKKIMTILLITHDLRIVSDIADRVLVMYKGRIIEMGSVEQVYRSPAHPYTKALLATITSMGMHKERELLSSSDFELQGKNFEREKGCHFAMRCPHALSICRLKSPLLASIDDNHKASCWLHEKKTS